MERCTVLGLDEGCEGLPGHTISDFVDRFDDACAAQERVVHVNAGADGPDTERDAQRRSMMSALDGAALGVTFGGPLVDAGAGIYPGLICPSARVEERGGRRRSTP